MEGVERRALEWSVPDRYWSWLPEGEDFADEDPGDGGCADGSSYDHVEADWHPRARGDGSPGVPTQQRAGHGADAEGRHGQRSLAAASYEDGADDGPHHDHDGDADLQVFASWGRNIEAVERWDATYGQLLAVLEDAEPLAHWMM